jgi:hypothetical protein
MEMMRTLGDSAFCAPQSSSEPRRTKNAPRKTPDLLADLAFTYDLSGDKKQAVANYVKAADAVPNKIGFSYLAAAGYHTTLLAFWDDVAVLSRYREGFVHKVYKSEIGVGAPDKPVQRRDKNVRNWYLTLVRHALYFLDAVNLAVVVKRTRRANPDVIIMDRYIYDEWANLPLRNRLTRTYIKALHALLPRPDISYLLDADPDAAHARKPEYAIDFMHRCRAAYYRLARLLGTMTIIPPLELEQAKQASKTILSRLLCDGVPANNRNVPATSTQAV